MKRIENVILDWTFGASGVEDSLGLWVAWIFMAFSCWAKDFADPKLVLGFLVAVPRYVLSTLLKVGLKVLKGCNT